MNADRKQEGTLVAADGAPPVAGEDISLATKGNARKTTGSYYTPDSLVQELIKSALEPVIADTVRAHPERPVESLLQLTICDPACGTCGFLVAEGEYRQTTWHRQENGAGPEGPRYLDHR